MDRYLAHHGIKGQKWGVRRFQNVNGTYTSKGKIRRYLAARRIQRQLNNLDRNRAQANENHRKQRSDIVKDLEKRSSKKNKSKWDKIKIDSERKYLNSKYSDKDYINKSYDKVSAKIINSAKNRNMTVVSTDTKRFISKRFLPKYIDYPLYAFSRTYRIANIRRAPGTKYKVRPK